MIKPVRFGYNGQTAATNPFMSREADTVAHREILKQFNNVVTVLRSIGIKVIVVKDTPYPATPDSIFPNNFLSTHSDGHTVLFPMCAPNRRDERKPAVLEAVSNACPGNTLVDLSYWENEGKFLEGTGSMVLDRVHRIAYASLSPRTSREVLEVFCNRLGYKPITFHSVDGSGIPIYHTNVMMSVCSDFAVLCSEAIFSHDELAAVKSSLRQSGKKIVEVSLSQMFRYACNMLELNDGKGNRYVAMSDTAKNALTDTQKIDISEFGTIVSADVHTIEAIGGGSVRCMLAEMY